MAETILVSVGLLLLMGIFGVALYVVVTKMRAEQDRRDYAAADRDYVDDEVGAEGAEAARREPPEAGDRRA